MKMTDPWTIEKFVLSGNATFTLVSLRTGKRFTYNLRRKKDDAEVFYLKVLRGPDLWRFAGVVRRLYGSTGMFVYLHSYKKGLFSTDAPSVRGFDYFINNLTANNLIHPQMEFWHEGKCGRCGRALTVPDSIATGLGPDCAAMMGVQMRNTVKESV